MVTMAMEEPPCFGRAGGDHKRRSYQPNGPLRNASKRHGIDSIWEKTEKLTAKAAAQNIVTLARKSSSLRKISVVRCLGRMAQIV
jgi:hypothetical protein